MLKGRSLKSCAALVVFCFSLVVACISPVSAATVGVSSSPFTAYFAPMGTPDIQFSGKPFVLPITSSSLVSSFPPTSNSTSVGIYCGAFDFEPFDFDVTFYFNPACVASSLGLSSNGSSVDFLSDSVPTCFGSSEKFRNGQNASAAGNYSLSYSLGTVIWGALGVRYSTHRPVYIVLPAGTDSFICRFSPWKNPNFTGDWGLAVLSSYLIYTSDTDVSQHVVQILEQVKQINGNTASALSTLNQILVQCKALKADTSTIISILGLCKDQLITLNGKVDDIYKLLKDSLATESGAVDKKSEELAGQIMQRVDSEQYWNDKNTENFNALDMGNWSFADGVVGALPTVGNLFKSLWDSIGDASLIFIFPLMLGIALVIVGRVSRTAGKGQKKGGGVDE